MFTSAWTTSPRRCASTTRTELADVYSRLRRADAAVLEEGATTCCYAKSEKSWVTDPQGVRWGTFYTTGESTVFGSDPPGEARPQGCCAADRAA